MLQGLGGGVSKEPQTHSGPVGGGRERGRLLCLSPEGARGVAREPTSAWHPQSQAEESFLLPGEIALPFPPWLLTPPHTVPTCRQVPCSSCSGCLSAHLGCPTPDPAPHQSASSGSGRWWRPGVGGSLLLGFSVMLKARQTPERAEDLLPNEEPSGLLSDLPELGGPGGRDSSKALRRRGPEPQGF